MYLTHVAPIVIGSLKNNFYFGKDMGGNSLWRWNILGWSLEWNYEGSVYEIFHCDGLVTPWPIIQSFMIEHLEHAWKISGGSGVLVTLKAREWVVEKETIPYYLRIQYLNFIWKEYLYLLWFFTEAWICKGTNNGNQRPIWTLMKIWKLNGIISYMDFNIEDAKWIMQKKPFFGRRMLTMVRLQQRWPTM